MSRKERIREQLVVTPGNGAAIADRDPGWSGGPDYEGLSQEELKAEAKAVLAQGVEDLSEAQELLWASDTLRTARRLPGDGRRREGQRDQARDDGRQPAGRSGGLVQDAILGGARPRLPLAHRGGLPERGRIGIFNRSHYEEVVALRVHPEWLGTQRLPARPRRAEDLGGALRGHQRLRAAPRPERHEDRQVLPPRLQGGAEAALPRAARHARQGVEVQCGRRRRARAAGTSTCPPSRRR